MSDDPRDAIGDGQAHTASGDPIPAPPDPHDPDGPEPMTEPQLIHLHALSEEAGEQVDDSLSKAEADRRIAELETRLPGRGQD